MDESRNFTESKEKLEGKITEGEVEVEKRNTSKGLFDSLFQSGLFLVLVSQPWWFLAFNRAGWGAF